MTVVKYWECAPPCGAVNDLAQTVCEACGADRPVDRSSPPPITVRSVPPAYRVIEGRTLVRAAPEERCSECGKSVREHIEEFKRAGRVIEGRAQSTR